ncbi:MAG: hypothetical protein SNJ71_01430 [Bacteroidales bacterium]
MFSEDDSFDALFAQEDETKTHEPQEKYKVLIVDDENDIHSVIKLALDGFNYKGKGIQFYDAYSGREARKVLEENTDIAVILLDVVMESNEAGLNFVRSR